MRLIGTFSSACACVRLPRTPDGFVTTKSIEPESNCDPSTADAESSERDEDLEIERRRQKAKKLRQETAERIRRLQAIAEEQRRYENCRRHTYLACLLTFLFVCLRKEQDRIEQGLLRYKNRQKELDRVAKGLGPPRKPAESAAKQTTEVSRTELLLLNHGLQQCEWLLT